MLKCRDMAEIVTRYLEDALPSRTRAAVHLHLWLCGPCRRYVAQMRETIRFLAQGPRRPPADEDEIMARLEAGRREK